MRDKPFRSVLKTISWRLTGTVDTIVIAYLITHELKWALSIGAIEVFTKLILYYFHERIWDRINIGRIKPPDYQI
ncbi:hypothetical protein DID80_01980 [Candidatus Marinamargulisbacteria bacterium SCGC AAA071-K20]|nr:hypothetical protein DID80_01980 [Candidatus Marinamargulisbacteria bacterium SCGC AAA071-K20]